MNKHDFFAFLDAALTPYHAADAANRFLAEKGFTALDPTPIGPLHRVDVISSILMTAPSLPL